MAPLGRKTLRFAVVALIALAVAGLIAVASPTQPNPEQVTPREVPVPDANAGTAVITVKIGGDRSLTSEQVIAPAFNPPNDGVTLELWAGDSSGPTAEVGETWAVCTSDDDGDCSFVVPETAPGGANRDRRFWIREAEPPAPPTGWYEQSALWVSMSTTNFAEHPYQFRTGPQLRAGSVYRSTTDFMIGTSGVQASSGIWQVTRLNPLMRESCGLNIAVVLDLSASVTAPLLTQLKDAAKGFVAALEGTPSRVALYTFGTTAPAAGINNINRPLTPVSTATGVAQVQGWIDGLSVLSTNFTNWDRGLYQVAQATTRFDAAIIITDGNPTKFGANPSTSGGPYTRFVELEHAVFSANAVKAEGTRVLAVGVGLTGADEDRPEDNLIAISGPTEGSDYLNAESYAAAAERLQELALAGCESSITVIKNIVPPGNENGDITGAVPAGGWRFDASATTPTPPTPPDPVISPASGITAIGTGAVSFDLNIPVGESATATITEVTLPDYALYQVDGGQNARCRWLNPTVTPPPTVTNTANGFMVDVPQAAGVTCEVYNIYDGVEPPPELVSLQVDKEWTVNQVIDTDGDGDADTVHQSVTYSEGDQPQGLNAHFTITETVGGEVYDDLAWGFVYEALLPGTEGILTETVEVATPLCRVTDQRITAHTVGGQPIPDLPPEGWSFVDDGPYEGALGAGGDNRIEITNTVECRTLLTLNKLVLNGSAQPDDWTLTASLPGTAPAGALAGPIGPGGAEGITADVTSGVQYVLAESGGSPNYVQFAVPYGGEAPEIVNGSTVSWFCAEVQEDQGGGLTELGWLVEGLSGGITLPLGAWVRCTAVNATAELTVFKVVEGGDAEPSDWTITASPVDSGGPPAIPLTGDTNGVTTDVLPGQDYVLAESPGPPGYVLTDVFCVWVDENGDEGVADYDYLVEPSSPDPSLSVGMLEEGLCEFTNVYMPAEVSFAKTHSLGAGATVAVGDRFDYVLTATNIGDHPALDVVVSDTVPAQLRVINVAVPPGWTNQTTGNNVRAVTPSLAVDATAAIRVTVEVLPSAVGTVPIVNGACVAADNDLVESNCADVQIPPPPPESSTTSSSSTSSSTTSSTTLPLPSSSSIAPSSSVPDGTLPPTGADSTRVLMWIALTTIVAGGALVGVRRVRRPSAPSADQ